MSTRPLVAETSGVAAGAVRRLTRTLRCSRT